MAAALKFSLKGTEYEAVPVKLERKKLYGWTDVVATDASGGTCTTAQVDPDGELLIPPGAVKSALLDADGAWVERSELVAVDENGAELPIVPSSFGQTISLVAKATEGGGEGLTPLGLLGKPLSFRPRSEIIYAPKTIIAEGIK